MGHFENWQRCIANKKRRVSRAKTDSAPEKNESITLFNL